MTVFAHIPTSKIKIHPDNPRRVAVADEELVDSVKSQGILQAISVVQDGDDYLLLMGHRRLDAAQRAGLTSMPASILEHLTTRGQQIEAMLVENINREQLTPIEEAKAYEQLSLEGYKPKDIAKATGRSLSTVQSRLQLTTLSDPAQEAIHSHQITLEDAATLAALEDFPEILARVEAAIGKPSFASTLRNTEWEVQRETKHRATRAEYVAAGLTLIEKPEDGWDFTIGPVPYRGALDDGVADAYYETNDGYTGPSLAKLTPAAADPDAAAKKDQEESQWEKRRAEREARDAARTIAQSMRVEHAHGMFAGVKLPATVTPLVAIALAAESINLSEQYLDLYTVGGLTRKAKNTWEDDWDLHAQVTALKPAPLTAMLFGSVISSAEDLLTGRIDNPTAAQAALDYIYLLTGTGYVLADIEVEMVDAIKAHLTVAPEDEEA